METTVIIDGKEYTALYNGRAGMNFRNWFGKDILVERDKVQAKAIQSMSENLSKAEKGEATLEEENRSMINYIVDADKDEFLIKALYTCIRTNVESNKEKFLSYDKFVDSVEDYESLVVAGYIVYDMIMYGNRTTVEPSEEVKKKESKKKGKKK